MRKLALIFFKSMRETNPSVTGKKTTHTLLLTGQNSIPPNPSQSSSAFNSRKGSSTTSVLRTFLHKAFSPCQHCTFSLHLSMEIESIQCECCGLCEDCTEAYIQGVKAIFDGKWLCGLCSEVVRDEASRGRGRRRKKSISGVEEAIKAHISFCRESKSNPGVSVSDAMREILRRRSADYRKPESPVFNHGRGSLRD